MKAVVHSTYGPPEDLQLTDVAAPIMTDNGILIKIHATTVTRMDCGRRIPEPRAARIVSGIFRPKMPILGRELAGEVVAVGQDVKTFREGNEVFGLTGLSFGAHAEYICLPEDGPVVIKPANMTYQEAAAVLDGAIIALYSLSEARIRERKSILINGASGSIGSAAVQLARYFGLGVTAVCGTRNLELARSLGADVVVDYTRDDFTKLDQTFDVVYDAVGKSSFSRCRRLLNQGGVYIATDFGFLLQNVAFALWTSKFGSKKAIFPIPRIAKRDIAFIKDLIEAEKYTAVIDRSYPLQQISEAYRYVEQGHKTGSVVIIVEHGA